MSTTIEVEIGNARIERTFLGLEDHGIFTCMLTLAGDGWGQGFGGYTFDEPTKDASGKFLGRVGTAYAARYIMQLLGALEVESWEQLKGTLVRYRREGSFSGKLVAIGHPLKERWFYPAQIMGDRP